MIFVKDIREDLKIYWIKEINSKYFVRNKYIDIQYCKVNVEQNYYKLKYEFTFYVSNNFFLPPNSLIAKVVSPTFEIDNISLVKTFKDIDESINNIQKDTISVYTANFEIDISDDPFFTGTSNKSYDLNISFDFNSELLNESNSNIDPNIFERFLSELLQNKFDIKLNNHSYTEVENNQVYSHTYGYENDSDNNKKSYDTKIKFKTQNFSSVDYYIKKLFSLEIIENQVDLTISNVELTLNYKYESVNKSAKLSFVSEADYSTKNLSFILNNYETYFDESKKEIIFQPGENGIWFPFDTNGYYQIDFLLIINNKPIKYRVKNNYSYVFKDMNANFIVEKFYEQLINYEEIFYKE